MKLRVDFRALLLTGGSSGVARGVGGDVIVGGWSAVRGGLESAAAA